jgi:DNA-binding LacI/PurR family transcriptional regulator
MSLPLGTIRQVPQPPSSPLPTIDSVAAAAGVSKTTVSHVLSGNRPVARATAAKVRRVIAELGYRPNPIGQSLKSARSQTIGLVVPDVTNPFYPALARGLQEALVGSRYLLLLADTGGDPEAERAFIAEALQRRVDALVVSAYGLADEELDALADGAVPVVAVGAELADSRLDCVTADDERVAADAVAHLRARGHERIATIAGPEGSAVADRRLRGFAQALGGSTDAPVVHGGFTREGGRAAMEELLADDAPPTAVFCANDLMAIGALDAARAAGRAVPEDLALVGVDDIEAAELVVPALTTIRIPSREIGRVAGELLLARIQAERSRAARTILVGHELVVRDSS